ncbi:hypothetical protein ScPMuIL_017170 [Solemya velum]
MKKDVGVMVGPEEKDASDTGNPSVDNIQSGQNESNVNEESTPAKPKATVSVPGKRKRTRSSSVADSIQALIRSQTEAQMEFWETEKERLKWRC